MLRRPHAHHRDLHARPTTKPPPDTAAKDQARHLIRPTQCSTRTATLIRRVGTPPTAFTLRSQHKAAPAMTTQKHITSSPKTPAAPSSLNAHGTDPAQRVALATASTTPKIEPTLKSPERRSTALDSTPEISCLGAFRPPAASARDRPLSRRSFCGGQE